MSCFLNYGFTLISKTASATTSGTCHSEQPEGADNADDAGSTDADSSDIDSVLPAESDSETVAQSHITGVISSGSSSLPEISDSEDDPSLPHSQDSHLRALHIHQGPHQPIIIITRAL